MSGRLTRGRLVLASLVCALVLLGAATRPWVRVDLSGLLAGRPEALVDGSHAAPLVTAVALVALAAAAAVSIAGGVGRLIAGTVVLLAGLAAAVAAAAVLSDPVAAAATEVASSTAGSRVTAEMVTTTAWPYVAIAAAAALAGCGVLVLAVGRRWAVGRRFEAAGPPAARDPEPIADWDALTRGADPTAPTGTEEEG